MRLFRGKANCTACHAGPTFTDEQLHNTGVAWRDVWFTDEGAGKGRFKTPTLRELGRTAPYMHDGSLRSLDEVIDFYNDGARTNPWLDPEIQPLHLAHAEKKALIAFLKSLNGS
jgi:cytochrome c peroxidase